MFRIGATECAAAVLLPPVLMRYHEHHRNVRIELQTDTSGRLMERLLGRDLDAALVVESPFFTAVRTQAVSEEALVLLIPESFPPFEGPAAINGATFVAFAEGCGYRRYLEMWLTDSGIVPAGIIELGSYLSLLASVSAGTGCAVVPRRVLDVVSTDHLRVRAYPLPARLSRIKTLLAWRPDYTSAKLDALRTLLADRPDRGK